MTRGPLERVNLVHVETEDHTLPYIQLKVSVALVKQKLAQTLGNVHRQWECRHAAAGVSSGRESNIFGSASACSHASTFALEWIM